MFTYIKSINELTSLLKDIEGTPCICLDTETTGLDPYTSTLLLLQINTGKNIYLLDCRKLGKKIITYIVSLLKDSNVLVVGHNLSFDLKMLYHNTKEMITNVYDTQVAEMLIHAGIMRKFPSYKELASKYCFVEIVKETRNSFINYTGELTNEQLIYSALDVRWLFDIRDSQLKEIERLEISKICDLEMKLVHVFAKMEYVGIGFDPEKWLAIAEDEEKKAYKTKENFLDTLFDRIDWTKYENAYDAALALRIPVNTKRLTAQLKLLSQEYIQPYIRKQFNMDSNTQMPAALNLAGIPVIKTNEKDLNKFKKDPLISILLEYREAEKNISTYGKSFLAHINPVTGRIHTGFNQLVSTGRISSNGPNLQNLPRLSKFRDCFVAKPGYKIVTVDLSQAELRLMAAVSRDPEMIKAFLNNLDLHKKAATIIFNKPIEDITSEERFWGKTLNFSLNYGISPWGLHNRMGLSLEEGELYIANYFKGFKVLKYFIDKAGEAIWNKKVSITPYGRKRFFEDKKLFRDVYEADKYKAQVKREGVNHIIQGGIADPVKLAMLETDNQPFGDKFNLLLQVHDELVAEVEESVAEKAGMFLTEIMQAALQPFLKEIPAVADMHIADVWSKT